MVRKEKKRRSENQEVMFVYRFFFFFSLPPSHSVAHCRWIIQRNTRWGVGGGSKNSHESMQMAHGDDFPFTDLSLLMGIREGRFNWLATACTRTLSRGCGEEQWD